MAAFGQWDRDDDMGMGDEAMNPQEFMIVAPHVARCLEGSFLLGISRLRYAFLVTIVNMREFEMLLDSLAVRIGLTHTRFFDLNGRKIFQLRTSEGTVRHGFYMIYLVTD